MSNALCNAQFSPFCSVGIFTLKHRSQINFANFFFSLIPNSITLGFSDVISQDSLDIFLASSSKLSPKVIPFRFQFFYILVFHYNDLPKFRLELFNFAIKSFHYLLPFLRSLSKAQGRLRHDRGLSNTCNWSLQVPQPTGGAIHCEQQQLCSTCKSDRK